MPWIFRLSCMLLTIFTYLCEVSCTCAHECAPSQSCIMQHKCTIFDACRLCHSILSALKPVFHRIRQICCYYNSLRCLDFQIWQFLCPRQRQRQWHDDNTTDYFTPCACAQGNNRNGEEETLQRQKCWLIGSYSGLPWPNHSICTKLQLKQLQTHVNRRSFEESEHGFKIFLCITVTRTPLLEILDQPLYIVLHSHCKVHCAAEEAALRTAQLCFYIWKIMANLWKRC